MTTKAYLRSSSYVASSGTLPSGEQDSQSPSFSATGASTLREAVLSEKGASMTYLQGSTLANTSAQAGFMGMWALAPLSGAQTVGGASETITVNVADYESNLSSNFYINRAHVYVWRPSTNSKVGDCCTYATSPGGSPAEPTSASQVQVTAFTVDLSSVSASDGDVIVIELWSSFTQSAATSYTARIYYDGATETTVENTQVSDHAAFVEFSQTFTLSSPVPRLTQQHAIPLYQSGSAEARLTQQHAIPLYQSGSAEARLTQQHAIPLYQSGSAEARLTQQYAVVLYTVAPLVIETSSGSVVYTGKQPVTSSVLATSPSSGSIVYTGAQPTEIQTALIYIATNNGNEAYSGNSPSELVAKNKWAYPSNGSKVYTGQQPFEAQTWSVSPSPGNELYSGKQPNFDYQIFTQPGSELYNGSPAALAFTVSPTTGNEYYEGKQTSLDMAIGVSNGQVVYAGNAVSLNYSISTANGDEVYTGNKTSLDLGIFTSQGDILYIGLTTALDLAIHTGYGQQVYYGGAPTLNYSILTSSGSVLYAGKEPRYNLSIGTHAGNVLYSGVGTGIGFTVSPSYGSVLYTGLPSIARYAIHTNNCNIVYSGKPADLFREDNVHPKSAVELYSGQRVYPHIRAINYLSAKPFLYQWYNYDIVVKTAENITILE